MGKLSESIRGYCAVDYIGGDGIGRRTIPLAIQEDVIKAFEQLEARILTIENDIRCSNEPFENLLKRISTLSELRSYDVQKIQNMQLRIEELEEKALAHDKDLDRKEKE